MIDFERAETIVREDVEGVLRASVDPDGGGGFRIHEGYEWAVETPLGIFNADGLASAFAVPWQWIGVHRGDLLGLYPMRGEELVVTVAGLTVVREVEPSDEAPDGLLLHRFVDWLDTLKQIGARTTNRQIIDVRRRFGDDVMFENERFRQVILDNDL